jgi:nicotinate-nucleotide adenylyltransferase
MRRPASVAGVLGLFGGTFDPLHIGHLRTAYELRARLGIDLVHFIPAAVPPHRAQPVAPIALRVEMLQAALANEAGMVVDLRELDREGPSYSVDTAESLRAEYPQHALCLLLGMDAFLGLPDWHDWERLLGLVNIVVARRPWLDLPRAGTLAELLAERRVDPTATETWQRAGRVIIQDVTQLEVSATDLRVSIRAGIDPKYLVPDAVRDLIAESGCYAE